MLKIFFTCLVTLGCLTLSLGQNVVQLKNGKISGVTTSDHLINSYKGIPFAAPPVGVLRWKAPQPCDDWQGVRVCDHFSPSPMQGKPVPFSMWSQEFLIPENPISEDCLYLNVWSGAQNPQEKRPVVVWIYGGGFSSGGSGVPIYDGEAMARRGIIFVSINYRVGIFGFFSHPELSAESKSKAWGNYGLMDQIAALKWVKENIAAFGGDPENVTIAGQSAGSMSVNCLVASPQAKGLFHRAIAHSGASFSGNQANLVDAEQAGLETAQKLNSPSLAQLRNISSEELMGASYTIRGPIIDGYVLPEQIVDIFDKGQQNPVDLLTGWTQEEGLVFGPLKNANDYIKQVEETYGNQAQKVLSYYPASNDQEAEQSQLDLARDRIFGTQNYAWANRQSEQGRNRTYMYRFTRKVPGTGQYAKYGAFHTGDVPYAYHTQDFVDRPWQEIDRKLSDIMLAYWTNFITSGNPNADHLPEWPEYHSDAKKIVILGDHVESKTLPDAKALELIYSTLIN